MDGTTTVVTAIKKSPWDALDERQGSLHLSSPAALGSSPIDTIAPATTQEFDLNVSAANHPKIAVRNAYAIRGEELLESLGHAYLTRQLETLTGVRNRLAQWATKLRKETENSDQRPQAHLYDAACIEIELLERARNELGREDKFDPLKTIRPPHKGDVLSMQLAQRGRRALDENKKAHNAAQATWWYGKTEWQPPEPTTTLKAALTASSPPSSPAVSTSESIMQQPIDDSAPGNCKQTGAHSFKTEKNTRSWWPFS